MPREGVGVLLFLLGKGRGRICTGEDIEFGTGVGQEQPRGCVTVELMSFCHVCRRGGVTLVVNFD